MEKDSEHIHSDNGRCVNVQKDMRSIDAAIAQKNLDDKKEWKEIGNEEGRRVQEWLENGE